VLCATCVIKIPTADVHFVVVGSVRTTLGVVKSVIHLLVTLAKKMSVRSLMEYVIVRIAS